MTWARHVACIEGRRNIYRVLVGSHGRKKSLGSPRRRWENNTKMDLQGVGCRTRTELLWLELGIVGGPSWTRLWTLSLKKNAENFLTSWGPVSFSRRTVLHGVSLVVWLRIKTIVNVWFAIASHTVRLCCVIHNVKLINCRQITDYWWIGFVACVLCNL